MSKKELEVHNLAIKMRDALRVNGVMANREYGAMKDKMRHDFERAESKKQWAKQRKRQAEKRSEKR